MISLMYISRSPLFLSCRGGEYLVSPSLKSRLMLNGYVHWIVQIQPLDLQIIIVVIVIALLASRRN